MADYKDLIYTPVAYPSGLMNSSENVANVADQAAGGYGLRQDGTSKGQGYFGPLTTSAGDTITELSSEDIINGKPTLYPLVTPNQSFADLSNILTGGAPTQTMRQLALQHAFMRALSGQSPFVTEVPSEKTK